ncbi:hypothetical protein BDV96DRAFT_603550 [Lophiotrema nucula]|uniref:Uncharacterized protein n=1 Tax=Lophiotrema nucula TaxID=690887 RepID=A0A6A5YUR6_9PLEO|nr:hypothetical protein BDV96DRAFT_603550 [Lophiotrema nucula]
MASPTLLGVPPEVRLIVYRELFGLDDLGVTFFAYKEATALPPFYSAVTKICRLLRDEATECLYNHLEFRFDTSTDDWYSSDVHKPIDDFIGWTLKVGPGHAAQLRRVAICLPLIRHRPMQGNATSHLTTRPYIDLIKLATLAWDNPRCTITIVTSPKPRHQPISLALAGGIDSDYVPLYNAAALNLALQMVVWSATIRQQVTAKILQGIILANDGASGYMSHKFSSSSESRRHFSITSTGISYTDTKTKNLLDLPTPILHKIYGLVLGVPSRLEVKLSENSSEAPYESFRNVIFASVDSGIVNTPSQLTACKSMYAAAKKLFFSFCTFEMNEDVVYSHQKLHRIWLLREGLAQLTNFPYQKPAHIRINLTIAGRHTNPKTVHIHLNDIIDLRKCAEYIDVAFKHGQSENCVSLYAIYASLVRFKAQRLDPAVATDEEVSKRLSFWANCYGEVIGCNYKSASDFNAPMDPQVRRSLEDMATMPEPNPSKAENWHLDDHIEETRLLLAGWDERDRKQIRFRKFLFILALVLWYIIMWYRIPRAQTEINSNQLLYMELIELLEALLNG